MDNLERRLRRIQQSLRPQLSAGGLLHPQVGCQAAELQECGFFVWR